jgi:hypothetical protein
MTEAGIYRPPFASERLLPRNKETHTYTGCRISTMWHGYAVATLGESTLNDQYRVKNRAARKRDLKAGLQGTGEPDRHSFNQGHLQGMASAMFHGLPEPEPFNRPFDQIWRKLGKNAVSLAVLPAAIEGRTKLDDYTEGPHQILVLGRNKPGTKALIYDPMAYNGTRKKETAADADKYRGVWVSKAQLRAAAEAVVDEKEGVTENPVAELYPIGRWTAKARRAAKLKGDHAKEMAGLEKKYSKTMDRQKAVQKKAIDGLKVEHEQAIDELKAEAGLDTATIRG